MEETKYNKKNRISSPEVSKDVGEWYKIYIFIICFVLFQHERQHSIIQT